MEETKQKDDKAFAIYGVMHLARITKN